MKSCKEEGEKDSKVQGYKYKNKKRKVQNKKPELITSEL